MASGVSIRVDGVFVTIESPGDDLSYLLFKHPGRVQSFDLPVGEATVFYPRADAQSTKAALLVNVDSAALARSKRFKVDGFELGHHINDRAYAASSLLAVAIGRVFRSAMTGADPGDRPGSAAEARDLTIHLPSVRSRGGKRLVKELFEPLGWRVSLVESVPTCVDVTLRGTVRLAHALSQLYVLLPVLDDSKHYWVGEAEIGKLLRYGEGWLAGHPVRDMVMTRYLAHRRRYVADAVSRLEGETPAESLDSTEEDRSPGTLGAQRTAYLVAKLRALGAWRVLDLGCGEGWLVRELLSHAGFEVVGADVSARALEFAATKLERISDHQRQRVALIQASATYRDERFCGFDAIAACELIEHSDPGRLGAFEHTLFAAARPGHVIVTTPNADYNQIYGLAQGQPRHLDHRFEWSRAQFQEWAGQLAGRNDYSLQFEGVGPCDPELGQPTQVAVFSRTSATGGEG
jgi:3' terminal RNA ribose 2'-O-methyltransferase Hen1